MKKVILLISMLLFFTVSVSAEEHVYQSDEEFFRTMAKLEKKLKEEKAKGRALDRLEKTVDKLAKKLKVDD